MELNIKQWQLVKLINNLFNIPAEKEYYKKYKSATFQENSFIRLLGDYVKHDDVKVAFLYLENKNYAKNKLPYLPLVYNGEI